MILWLLNSVKVIQTTIRLLRPTQRPFGHGRRSRAGAGSDTSQRRCTSLQPSRLASGLVTGNNPRHLLRVESQDLVPRHTLASQPVPHSPFFQIQAIMLHVIPPRPWTQSTANRAPGPRGPGPRLQFGHSGSRESARTVQRHAQDLFSQQHPILVGLRCCLMVESLHERRIPSQDQEPSRRRPGRPWGSSPSDFPQNHPEELDAAQAGHPHLQVPHSRTPTAGAKDAQYP